MAPSYQDVDDLRDLLSTYPRKRPPLTEAHKLVFEREYEANRRGRGLASGLSQLLEGWMHRRIAMNGRGSVLEIGAGTLNHVRYEHDAESYDIVEPFARLYQGASEIGRIRSIYASISHVPESERYQRIISVATLEHLTDLPSEVARCALRLAHDGVFQAGIPSEGAGLWWLGWRSTTGISFRLRTGLDYGAIMRHEHVNNAAEVIRVCQYLFDRVEVLRFPTPVRQLSLYTYFEARNANLGRCRKVLAAAGGGS